MRGEAGGGGGGQDGAGGVRGGRPGGPQQRVSPGDGVGGQKIVIRHRFALRSNIIGEKNNLTTGFIILPTSVVLEWMSCWTGRSLI